MEVVEVPVVDQPNDAVVAVVAPVGPDVTATVGAAVVAGAATDHVYVADALPAVLATVMRIVCGPAASPLYAFGERHATAVAPSSEQVVLETVPVVDHANVAAVDVVE